MFCRHRRHGHLLHVNRPRGVADPWLFLGGYSAPCVSRKVNPASHQNTDILAFPTALWLAVTFFSLYVLLPSRMAHWSWQSNILRSFSTPGSWYSHTKLNTHIHFCMLIINTGDDEPATATWIQSFFFICTFCPQLPVNICMAYLYQSVLPNACTSLCIRATLLCNLAIT